MELQNKNLNRKVYNKEGGKDQCALVEACIEIISQT